MLVRSNSGRGELIDCRPASPHSCVRGAAVLLCAALVIYIFLVDPTSPLLRMVDPERCTCGRNICEPLTTGEAKAWCGLIGGKVRGVRRAIV